MSETPTYKVGAVIIYSPEFYVLHKRKKGNDNGEIGKLGLYGGQFDEEQDKDTCNTASRELGEESGLLYPTGSFKYEDFLHTLSERNGVQTLTDADIFSLGLPGSLTTEQAEEIFRNSKALTPREVSAARAVGRLSTVATAAFGKIRMI